MLCAMKIRRKEPLLLLAERHQHGDIAAPPINVWSDCHPDRLPAYSSRTDRVSAGAPWTDSSGAKIMARAGRWLTDLPAHPVRHGWVLPGSLQRYDTRRSALGYRSICIRSHTPSWHWWDDLTTSVPVSGVAMRLALTWINLRWGDASRYEFRSGWEAFLGVKMRMVLNRPHASNTQESPDILCLTNGEAVEAGSVWRHQFRTLCLLMSVLSPVIYIPLKIG